jgi:GWxTD domain-containing protein
MLAGLVHTPVARALSWALIHFLWEGAAVAALLAAALFVFRPASARVRYGLACVALCAMLAAPAVTLGILWPRIHLDAGVLIRSGPPPAARLAPSTKPDPPPAPPPDRLAWVTPLWMAGVLIFYVRMAGSWAAAERLRRRGATVASAHWQDRLRALAQRLRVSRPVLMLESCLAETPAVVGYLRPAILIPAGLLTGLPPEQVEAILLHELAHIRRHDYAVNVLQTLVEGLLFYHPAVWWVSGVIRAERENCCDDAVVAVVGDARGYAAALAELEWRRSVGQPALAARGGNLMRRIRRLLEPEGPRSIAGPVLGATLLMASIAAGLMAWQPAAPQANRAVQEAQVVTPYRKWLDEDVTYIITSDERAAFQRLQTNEEREQFIEQFWLKRDPTPGTVANEFKEEHYRRIAYANEHFSDGIIPGWKSHRGMYYIKFGPPDEIDDHRDSRPPFLAWTYHHMQPAPGAGEATVVFTDVDGNGQFVLPKHNPASAIIMGTSRPLQVLNQTATVAFDVPSFGGPTAVYSGIESLAGATVAMTREEASPTYYTKSFQLQPGVYRIQVFVQRPGEGAMALFPRGQEFEIPGPVAAGGAANPEPAAQPKSAPPNQALIGLDNAILTVQINLAELRQVLTDSHPKVVAVQAQLKTLLAEREHAQAQAANADAAKEQLAKAEAQLKTLLAEREQALAQAATAAAIAGSAARQQSNAYADAHLARVPASDLDVTVGVKTLERKPPNPSRDVVITIQAPGASGKVEIYGQITTMARRNVGAFEESVEATPGQAWNPYQRTIPLIPGRYRLKVVVRDSMDGRIGSEETDIEVRP